MDLSKTNRKKYRIRQIALALAMLICVGVAFATTHQLNETTDLGNRKTVLNYGNQVAARLYDLFDQIDISLTDTSEKIQLLEEETAESLQIYLSEYQETWNLDASGWLYEDGVISLSDGSTTEFENEISLRDVLSYSDKLNISRQNINGQEMLVFAKPCQKQVDGREISGVFAAIKLERIETLLGDYGYSSDSFLVLTQNDGDNIWRQSSDEVEGTGNCFEELEQLSIAEGDSVQQMQTRMTVDMDGTIKYSARGKDFYMAYVPLGVNYWYLLVSTYSDSIDLTELSRQHFIISTLLIACILILGVVSTFYLIQRNHSISNYNKQLEVANKANQANRAKQEFLAKVSHDIRTPLNGVMGMIQLAKEDYPDQEACMKYLDKASISATYLLELLNDVLDMSQIESGKQRLIEETVDMRELLQEIETILETSAGDKGLTFSVESSLLVHRYFKGDPLRIKQILMNLCSNAVKYTPSGGWIRLEMGEKQEKGKNLVFFKVIDNGEGIAEDKLESIFKPFEQVSSKRQGGVGLGLSIVHSFVELMGGEITVESQVGSGSTFLVKLPLLIVEQPESALAENKNISLEGISVLLAEDNHINAEIAMALLKKRGATVTRVSNGLEAVEAFREAPPRTYQVILMDIQMPKMNGIDATKEIRNIDREDAKEIPILSMTANAFHEQTDEMLQAGMNDFLYKPIDIGAVCSGIKKWVKEE